MNYIPGLVLMRVIVYDALFCLFVLFGEPWLLAEMKKFTNPYVHDSNIYLGMLLIAALAAEVPGIYLKFRSMAEKDLAGGGAPGTRLELRGGVPVILLHIAVGVMLMFFAFMALGFTVDNNSGAFRVFFLVELAREGVIIWFMFGTKVPSARSSLFALKNNAADFLIFFFGIIAYTATWRNITSSDKIMETGSIAEIVIFLFFSAVLFLMFYLGSNMTTFYENAMMTKTPVQKLYRVVSLLVLTASVLWPSFRFTETEKRPVPSYSEPDINTSIEAERRLMEESTGKKKPLNKKSW